MTLTRSPSALAGADPDRFDPGIALTLAELAALAYRPGWEVAPALIEAGWDHGWLVSKKNAQALVAWSEAAIVVAVRGSDLGEDGEHWSTRILDWRHNARSVFRRAWDPYIPHGVGVGWRAQAEELMPGVTVGLGLAVRKRPEAPLIFVGHSAGGPIANAMAAVACHTRPDSSAVRLIATFSSPRPGGEPFSRWYDARFPQTWRVVPIGAAFQQDLVTRQPWSSWPVRAWHVGRPKILVRSVTPGETPRTDLYETSEAWEAVRSRREVGLVESLRVGTAMARSVRAHFLAYTIGLLRGMEAEREEARVAAKAEGKAVTA